MYNRGDKIRVKAMQNIPVQVGAESLWDGHSETTVTFLDSVPPDIGQDVFAILWDSFLTNTRVPVLIHKNSIIGFAVSSNNFYIPSNNNNTQPTNKTLKIGDICSVCGKEYKERQLFTGSFIGCMC